MATAQSAEPPLQSQQELKRHLQQQQLRQQSQQAAKPQKSGFFQGGLDVLVTSISSLGDTLGQALEEGIQHVSSDLLLGVPERRPPAEGGAKSKRATGVAQSSPIGSRVATNKVITGSKAGSAVAGADRMDGKPSHYALASSNERSAVAPPKDQLDASRSVANAMAVRAKQLQADLRNARLELEQLHKRCNELEEENTKLKHELAEGQHWEPSETEEQLREQVEHLLQEKSVLAKGKREVERENEKLHQLVEYYEQLHVNDEDAGWNEGTESVPGVNGTVYVTQDYSSAHYMHAAGFSPLSTPVGSSLDFLTPAPYLGSALSHEDSVGMAGSRSDSLAAMSDVAYEESGKSVEPSRVGEIGEPVAHGHEEVKSSEGSAMEECLEDAEQPGPRLDEKEVEAHSKSKLVAKSADAAEGRQGSNPQCGSKAGTSSFRQ